MADTLSIAALTIAKENSRPPRRYPGRKHSNESLKGTATYGGGTLFDQLDEEAQNQIQTFFEELVNVIEEAHQILERRHGSTASPSAPFSLISIVVVPAPEGPPVSEWSDASGSWLHKLSDDVGPQAEIWEYIFSRKREDIYPSYRIESRELADEVFERDSQVNHSSHAPLLFVTAGTGGILVKETFHRYRSNLDRMLSGIVFLGAPHITTDVAQAQATLDLLSKSGVGEPWSMNYQALMETCRAFTSSYPSVPILSVYETRGTKLAKNPFSSALWKMRGTRSRNPIILPESLCEIGVQSETLIAADTDHFGICKVPVTSPAFAMITKLAKGVQAGPRSRRVTLISRSSSIEALVDFQVDFPQDYLEISFPYFSPSIPNQTVPFHGRQDILCKIDDFLLPSSVAHEDSETSQVRSLALCGLGGIGKTSIAVEYAYTRRNSFDAIFWVKADDNDTLAQGFASIAKQLELVSNPEEHLDMVVSRDRLLEWLADPDRAHHEDSSYPNWLLIFDGADDIDILSDYWPREGRGAVLVTSRDQSVKDVYCKTSVDTQPFDPQESIDLIRELDGNTTTQKDDGPLTILAESLGGLPFAIVQAATVMRRLSISCAELVWILHESDTVDFEVCANFVHFWGLNTLDASARALLEVISMLDPDTPIKKLLEQKPRNLRMKYPTDGLDHAEARRKLLSLSLIEMKDAAKIRMNPLVRTAIKRLMNTSRLLTTIDSVISLLKQAWEDQIIGFSAILPSLSPLLPDILRLVPKLTSVDREFHIFIQEALRHSRTGDIPGTSASRALEQLLHVLEESPNITFGIAPERGFGDMGLGKVKGGFDLGLVEPGKDRFTVVDNGDNDRGRSVAEFVNESDAEDLMLPEEFSIHGADDEDTSSNVDSIEPRDQNPSTNKRTSNLAQIWTSALIKTGILEPPLPKERRRLRWKCACGLRGFDDLREGAPNGLQYLKDRIEAESGISVTVSTTSRERYNWPSGTAVTRACRGAWTSVRHWATFSSSSHPQKQSSALPQHHPVVLSAIQTQQPATSAPDPLLLLSCVRKGRGKRLVQDDVKKVSNDQELVHFLRTLYKTHRSKYRSIFSLSDVHSLALVKFQLLLGGTVATRHHQLYCKAQNCECLPPMYLILSSSQSQAEYKCDPVPADTEPPIPPELFWHLFTEPDCVKNTQKWILAQVPKRIKDELEGDMSKAVFGWGVDFQEGWSPFKVTLLILGGFVMSSIVFGVVWTVMKKDLQGAFGVSSWLVTLGAILLTLIVIRKSEM
ncbi:hypothetical protein BDV96DRAFT_644901 [Lophiotrema nucula]|uniref:Uncharacterized protein n=1 Tax=Lophiotrema nucula TaxID=690887 RepID=A0A6A5ZE09_9PLEO|nr:hypothetical protein BDV96DRAFT_644901 [Lophiotrema nucula]